MGSVFQEMSNFCVVVNKYSLGSYIRVTFQYILFIIIAKYIFEKCQNIFQFYFLKIHMHNSKSKYKCIFTFCQKTILEKSCIMHAPKSKLQR